MPGTRSLLETIQGLHEATQMIRTIWISKSRRLTHIYLLIKNTMEESILNIQLTKRPTAGDNHRKQDANGGWLDNRTETILIVNTITLFEPLSHQTSFVTINSAIGLPFDLIHPFAVNNIPAMRARHKTPSIVSEQSRVFFIHSKLPLRIRECFTTVVGSPVLQKLPNRRRSY
jgi:hypothetical protein